MIPKIGVLMAEGSIVKELFSSSRQDEAGECTAALVCVSGKVLVSEKFQVHSMNDRVMSQRRGRIHDESSSGCAAQDGDQPIHAAVQFQYENIRGMLHGAKPKPISLRNVPFAGALEFAFERVIIIERDNHVAWLCNLFGERGMAWSRAH